MSAPVSNLYHGHRYVTVRTDAVTGKMDENGHSMKTCAVVSDRSDKKADPNKIIDHLMDALFKLKYRAGVCGKCDWVDHVKNMQSCVCCQEFLLCRRCYSGFITKKFICEDCAEGMSDHGSGSDDNV